MSCGLLYTHITETPIHSPSLTLLTFLSLCRLPCNPCSTPASIVPLSCAPHPSCAPRTTCGPGSPQGAVTGNRFWMPVDQQGWLRRGDTQIEMLRRHLGNLPSNYWWLSACLVLSKYTRKSGILIGGLPSQLLIFLDELHNSVAGSQPPLVARNMHTKDAQGWDQIEEVCWGESRACLEVAFAFQGHQL